MLKIQQSVSALECGVEAVQVSKLESQMHMGRRGLSSVVSWLLSMAQKTPNHLASVARVEHDPYLRHCLPKHCYEKQAGVLQLRQPE